MFSRTAPAAIILLYGLFTATAHAGDNPYLRGAEDRRWEPVADEVYLQERAQKLPTPQAVLSVAAHGGQVHAVLKDGTLHTLENGALKAAPGAPAGVVRVLSEGGALWALAKDGLHRLAGGAWRRITEQKVMDLCWHNGAVHAAVGNAVFRIEGDKLLDIEPEGGYRSMNLTFEMEDGTQILPRPETWGNLLRITSYSETLYGLRPGSLALFDGEALDPTVADWGDLPSVVTRDMLPLGSRLFVATDRGLGVLRGMSMTDVRGVDGLPFEDTTCLAEGFSNDLWIGTSRGAIRMVDGAFHFFGADHWLPGDYVHDIAADDRAVYIATDGGLGIIHYEPYTLAKKAAYYERHLDAWGHKRLGFTHKLYWGGDDLGWVREISDNDGGHTAHYLAAMSYKYAATGDATAREEARNTFEAMLWLEEITPVRGFIARAVWSKSADAGQKAKHGSGGLPAKWYETEDGLWEWKGDTSSDEINAHFYSVLVYHDLVAEEGAEKARAAEHLTRIMDHILENGWLLRDMDGQPTRWGRWDPEYLQRPYGSYARGLNGMEAQCYAITAYAVSGDTKYSDALAQLLEWRYHHHTVRQKLTFPPSFNITWDDHLAFMCFYPMIKHTTDPKLRSIYQRSLARSWEIKRLEQVPWYNYVYGVATGNDCENEEAAAHLREWPLDCTNHSYRNSHRHDLYEQPGYVQYGAGPRAISPRESDAKHSSRSALNFDGGSGGRTVTEPTAWLEDYWMARYYGFITPPQTDDPALTTVEPWSGVPLGAKPYNGPPRPAIQY